jgi:hypothetical protein
MQEAHILTKCLRNGLFARTLEHHAGLSAYRLRAQFDGFLSPASHCFIACVCIRQRLHMLFCGFAHLFQLIKLAEAITLLVFIRRVPYSCLGRDTGSSEWRSRLSVAPKKCKRGLEIGRDRFVLNYFKLMELGHPVISFNAKQTRHLIERS